MGNWFSEMMQDTTTRALAITALVVVSMLALVILGSAFNQQTPGFVTTATGLVKPQPLLPQAPLVAQVQSALTGLPLSSMYASIPTTPATPTSSITLTSEPLNFPSHRNFQEHRQHIQPKPQVQQASQPETQWTISTDLPSINLNQQRDKDQATKDKQANKHKQLLQPRPPQKQIKHDAAQEAKQTHVRTAQQIQPSRSPSLIDETTSQPASSQPTKKPYLKPKLPSRTGVSKLRQRQ